MVPPPPSASSPPPSRSLPPPPSTPRGPESRLAKLRADALSGFLVFLIALPLSLGISLASGFPPVAGLLTAMVGGLLVSLVMGAPLTIKGPAAGLIVIALGAVTDLGGGDATLGYRRALACIVVAGALQAGLGLMKAGRIADFFPSSVVHGMLAAIGVIICAKQVHVMLGVTPHGHEPIELLLEIPSSLAQLNPEVLLVGAVSLVILFLMPMIAHPLARKIPAPMVVLCVAVPLGLYFDFSHEHTYTLAVTHTSYAITPRYLVTLPDHLISAITLPDFSVLTSTTSIRYVVMFALVGSIESLLSARAIDQLDKERHKSDYDRDLLAVGLGNVVAGLIGGLPMIAEIVRSKANLDAGARSRWSNFFHGAFLLVFVAFLPNLIHRIPLAALAAMLVYTGTRLASPSEFIKTFQIGREQLAVFVVTMIGCIGVDLLVGVALGIVTKLTIQLVLGSRFATLAKAAIEETTDGAVTTLTVRSNATFTNYLSIKARIYAAAARGSVIVDLSGAAFVDHTTLERLHDLEGELSHEGKSLTVRGTEQLTPLSQHPMAARRSVMPPAPR